MARAPQYKVYDMEGEYQAACKDAELAAAVVALLGDGATIRLGHAKGATVWTEGDAGDGHAGESYDEVAIKVHEREAERWTQAARALLPIIVSPGHTHGGGAHAHPGGAHNHGAESHGPIGGRS